VDIENRMIRFMEQQFKNQGTSDLFNDFM
jgi:hypothetical protein